MPRPLHHLAALLFCAILPRRLQLRSPHACRRSLKAMICSLLKAAVAEGQSRAAKPAGGRPSVIEVTKMHQIPVRYKAGAEGAAPGAKDLSVVINRDSKLYDDIMTKCYK